MAGEREGGLPLVKLANSPPLIKPRHGLGMCFGSQEKRSQRRGAVRGGFIHRLSIVRFRSYSAATWLVGC